VLQGAAGKGVCWREWPGGRKSFFVGEELPLELCPLPDEPVSAEDGFKGGGIQDPGFDELEKPGLVFGAAGLQRDGGGVTEMHVAGTIFHPDHLVVIVVLIHVAVGS